MPTAFYPTVVPVGKEGNGGLGSRNQTNLRASFADSPIYNDYSTKEAIKASADPAGNPAGGVVTGQAAEVNDNGVWGMSTFDLNFTSSPNLNDVETGGEGKPASPYYPNITSPGEGNANNPLAQPEYTGNPIPKKSNYGTGLSSDANPVNTAESIASNTVGKYLSGRSFIGSDGRT